MPKKILKQVQGRDPYCWHCGREDDLVPHHRINRGMGGSKLLDTVDNLMMVCALWNGRMESDAGQAVTARELGHKLSAWQSTRLPVFDSVSCEWFELQDDGSKVVVSEATF